MPSLMTIFWGLGFRRESVPEETELRFARSPQLASRYGEKREEKEGAGIQRGSNQKEECMEKHPNRRLLGPGAFDIDLAKLRVDQA